VSEFPVRWTSAQPKDAITPVKVQRRKARRKRVKWDEQQSRVVRARSGGVCEACGEQRAVHVHHKLGGHGVRGIGPSALAENKLHLCLACHQKAHGPKRSTPRAGQAREESGK
jgi:hypothetical protein